MPPKALLFSWCGSDLAHQGRRFQGAFILSAGVRRPSTKICPTEATGALEAKFDMEPLWIGETKVCSNGAGARSTMLSTSFRK